MQIAIDGPAGSGKTSIAKALAEKLGFIHLDTGAMFRALSVILSEEGVRDEKCIEERIRGLELRMIPQGVEIEGRELTDELRTEEIDREVSYYSQLRTVRDWLLFKQRQMADQQDVIMDGRDIATVVLPRAEVKIFLDASEDVRAMRRTLQSGRLDDYPEILADIQRRDQVDSQREIAPLKVAEDAMLIDTTEMSFDEVLETILRLVEEKR
ncbi:MAG: (d)CMP kinase [Tissierellia bacterium]|nr:(d)CMP kinase [Bacillota bacterium]NLL23545.1 (d)CMP kinase [Tissierellia bacterium]